MSLSDERLEQDAICRERADSAVSGLSHEELARQIAGWLDTSSGYPCRESIIVASLGPLSVSMLQRLLSAYDCLGAREALCRSCEQALPEICPSCYESEDSNTTDYA